MTPGTQTRMAAWLESAWLARYLDRQLEGEELAWFEAYLLDKPELVEAVEVDTALKESVARAQFLTLDIAQEPRAHSWLPRWTALAACLIASAGAGWLSRNMLSTPEIIVSPSRVVYDTMRSMSPESGSVFHDTGSRYVLFEIAVSPGAHQIYLHLDGEDASPLEESKDGFVSFIVDRKLLETLGEINVSYVDGDVTRTQRINLGQFRSR